jgi:fructose-1,6-bisphosphatase II
VILRAEGDIAGAIMAASPDVHVDILMGVGGVPEGLIAACAIKPLDGAMLGRLAPQSDEERDLINSAGLDTRRIYTANELVSGDEIFFAATGITDGVLLSGVKYRGSEVQTESLVLRCETGTRRILRAEHAIDQGIEEGE